MADNIGQKVAKIGEKNKSNNVVNRDGLRLGDSDKSAVHPTTLSTPTSGGPQRKKTPAFLITSVTVVNTRPSTDGGDDSADDLDESHTDDTSDVLDVSRITDIENETPSFSEDTFSKEDVFFNASTAASLGSAPVIPTSAQYGLAILASEGGTQPVTTSTVPTNSEPPVATETGNVNNVVNCVNKQDSEMRDVHSPAGRNERFKVVKIESTVPFKRGRWTCMDYLDHSTMQQQSQQAIINVTKNLESESNVNSLKYCGTDSGVVLTDGLASNVDNVGVHENHRSYAAQEHQQPYGCQVNLPNLSGAQGVGVVSVSPGQTLQQTCPPTGQQLLLGQSTHLPHVQGQMINPQVTQQNIPVHHPQSLSQVQLPQQNLVANATQAQQHQSLPPHQFQQVIANANLPQQQAQSVAAQQSYVGQQPASQGIPPVMVSQQTSYYVPPASGVVTSVALQTTGVSTVAQGPVQLPVPTQPVNVPVQPVAPTAVPISQVPSLVTVVSQAQLVHHSPSVAHVSNQQQMEQKIQQIPVQQIPIQQPQIAVQQPVLQQHQMQHPNPQIHLQQGAPTQTQLQPPVCTQHLSQQPVLSNQQSPNTQQHVSGVQTVQQNVPPSPVPLGNIIQSAGMMTVPNAMMGQMQTVVMQPTSSAPAFISQTPQISVSQPNLVPSPVQLATVYQNPSLVGTGTLPSAQWSTTTQTAPLVPGTVATAEPTSTTGPTKETPQSEAGSTVKLEPPEINKNTEEAVVTVTNVEDTERSAAAVRPRDLGGDPDGCSLSVPRGPPPNTPMSRAASPVPPSDSASGTSAVAIDNKIEQAMDLVKSHLMFAVREEVEVLKERIAELMDRIGQLEMENTILKAHATQEVLAQLGQQQQTQLPAGNGMSTS